MRNHIKRITMKKLFALLLLIASTSAFGQNYHPLIRPNLVWQILHGDGAYICNLRDGHQYSFQGDTLISGFTYQKIKTNPIIALNGTPYYPPFAVDGNSPAFLSGLMREDTVARKVFIYNFNFNYEELVYDFNLIAGDTLNSYFAGQGSALIVDSVSTISLLNGSLRKIFYMNSGENYIESIGGSQGIQYPLIQGIGFWEVPICISENNIPIWGGQCFGTVGINENLNQSELIYPNPFIDEISIKTNDPEESQFILFDNLSREVFLQDFIQTTTFNFKHLKNGVYTYKMIRKSGSSSFGKVIKL